MEQEDLKPISQMKRRELSAVEKSARAIFPKPMADFVFGEVIHTLAEEVNGDIPSRKPPRRGYTYGGGENIEAALWGLAALGDARPDDSLDWDVIDSMMRTGQVRFAVEVKRAAVLSALFSELQWQIECKDEKLGEVVQKDLARVFSTYGYEMLTLLEYGAFFAELIWEYIPRSMRGLDGEEKYWCLESLNTIKPHTIETILRTKSGPDMGRFKGFQQEEEWPWPRHTVPKNQALILTHRKKFRSLWGESILDPAYPLWYWFDLILAFFLRYLDRCGTPLVVARGPSRGTMTRGDGESMSTMDYALLTATEAARSNAIALPSDRHPETGQYLFDLTYLTDDKRGDQYVKALQFIGDLLTRSIVMGAMADLSQEGGGYNREMAYWGITQLDNQMILSAFGAQLGRYLLPKYTVYNATPLTYIAMVMLGLDPDKIDRIYKFLSTAGNQQGSDALLWPDWKQVMDISSIPTISESEMEKLKKEKEDKALEMQKTMMQSKQEGPPQKGGEKKEAPVKKEETEKLIWRIIADGVPIVLTHDDFERFAMLNPDLVHDGTVVELYNPYHDKLGRFASKAQSAGASAKDWVSQNKGKIAVAGAATVALIAAGVVIYSRKGSDSGVIHSDAKGPRVDPNAGNVKKETVKSAVENVRAAEKEWESLGYRLHKRWQTAMHDNPETFKNTTGQDPSGIKLVSDGDDKTGYIHHFSPDAVRDMAESVKGEAATLLKGAVTRGFLEGDGGDLQLFNPYHDERGRFTSKAAGAVAAGVGAAAKETILDPVFVASAAVVASGWAREAARSSEEKAALKKGTDEALGAIPEDLAREGVKTRHHAGIGTYVLAAGGSPLAALSAGFTRKLGDDTIHLSPSTNRALTHGDPGVRAWGKHVVVHEALHARKRIGAGAKLDKVPVLGLIRSKINTPFEEGMTDILASQISGVSGSGAYSKHKDRIARMAMAVNKRNKKRATQWIKDSHLQASGPFAIASDLRDAGHDVSGWDVFMYGHGGGGKLGGLIGDKPGYGSSFTRDTRRFKGKDIGDTNLRRIATGTTEALAANYVWRQTRKAVINGLIEGWVEWNRQSDIYGEHDPAIYLQQVNEDDWDLDPSTIALAIGADGISEIIEGLPPGDREDAMLLMGLGLDSIGWSSDAKIVLEYQLYNPYHDELGRFASKSGAKTISRVAGYTGPQAVARAVPSTTPGGIIGKRIGAKKAEEKFGSLPDEEQYTKNYNSLSDRVKGVVAAPAEYLARKKGWGPRLGRFAIEFGSDIAIDKIVGGWAFANAAPLGVAATGALTAALFGATAPVSVLFIGGFAVGVGASLIASEIVDWGQSKAFHAYLNRYAPKDNAHIQFSGMSTGKKAGKAYKAYSTVQTMLLVGGMEVIRYAMFGDTSGMEEAIMGLEEEPDRPSTTRLFTVAIWPQVLTVLMDDDIKGLEFPDAPELRGFPGFRQLGDGLIMDWDGAHEFAEHWADGDFPELPPDFSFGDTEIRIEKELEADADPFELANPYHDERGRFTSKGGAWTTSGKKIDAMRQSVEFGKGSKAVNRKRFESAASQQAKDLAKRLPGCEDPPRISVVDMGRRYAGAHVGGEVLLSPRIAKRATRKKPNFGHHTILHERIHARKRTQGRYSPGSWQEEGVTELLARRLYKDIYDSDSPSRAYNRYVDRVGRAAWQQSNGNVEAAWGYVDQVHNGEKELDQATDGAGWQAMMDVSYKFEEEDELMEQLLDLIEMGDWEAAEELVEAHPEDDNLALVFGEAWIAEFGVNERA